MKEEYLEKFDIAVVGAGASGVAAAVAAAREGLSVLLIERYGFTGGTATAGLVHHWDPVKLIEASGIAIEFYERLKLKGAIKDFEKPEIVMPFTFWEGGSGFDPEEFKIVCLEMLEEAGVACLFHTQVIDAVVENGKITAVEIYNKSGKNKVKAKIYVDATGDGDVFAYAGCRYQTGNVNGEFMSPTLAFRIGGVDTEKIYQYFDENPDEFGNHPRLGKYIKNHRESILLQGFYTLLRQAKENGSLKATIPETGIGMLIQPRYGEFHVNATRTPCKNPLDGRELSKLEIMERKNVLEIFSVIKKYLPGCENAYMMQTADQVGIRETRRLCGEYVLTLQDMENGIEFKDKIMRSKWAHCDVHSPKTMQWSFKFIEGPYYMPYRSLISLDITNLLVAGRCASTTSEAMSTLRIIPIGALMGQAAGTAAAVSLTSGQSLKGIDIKLLQNKLIQHGVIL